MNQQPHIPTVRTIPSSDAAFAALVGRVVRDRRFRSPRELATRLRRLFPRVVVRERALSGEAPIWYVYRDGSWRPDGDGPWWTRADLPRVVVSDEGLIVEANALARGILGLGPASSSEPPRHVSEVVAPGALGDSIALFDILRSGRELLATVLLRPVDGDVIACDLRAWREGDRLVGVLRLAEGIEVPAGTGVRPRALEAFPPSDVVFAQFARDVLDSLHDATPQALEVGLRRLFPHASVAVRPDGSWAAFRDHEAAAPPTAREEWWSDVSLPRVRYDVEGLILEANDAAQAFLGRSLVGHHWHEFVTPTASDVVTPVLGMIRRAHAAVSRFRMPRGDGSLVEFDSYTTAEGDTLTTVMRPIGGETASTLVPANGT